MLGQQPGFFDVDERLRELSAKGDDLERIAGLVDFEMFRPALEAAVPRLNGAKGGCPPFDHVLMFKVLLLQAHAVRRTLRVSDPRSAELHALPRRGAGRSGARRQHDQALKRAGAVDILFQRFDATLRAAGYLARSGQIVDATIIGAPKQRNTEAERATIKAGQIPQNWAEKPSKLRQKDRDACWTVKFSKAKPRQDGTPQVDSVVPAFGYKNHVSIDRRHGLIRRWTATDAAAHDGARLAVVIDPRNTARDVWADTAYRSARHAFSHCFELTRGRRLFTPHYKAGSELPQPDMAANQGSRCPLG